MAETVDPCPHCGQTFDHNNEGARKNHIRACREEAEKYQQQQPDPPQVQEAEPNGGLPASEPADAGEGIGAGIGSALDDDAPIEQRAEGMKQVASLAGGLFSGLMRHRDQKKKRQQQRAKQADLEPVDDKPHCEECGATFSAIPETATRVQCSQCGTEYRVE